MILGDLVRDKVTGFTGRVLAHKTALYEVDEWRVHPESLKPDDGSITLCAWIEEGRLEVVHATEKLAGFKVVNGGSLK